ncbi:phage virion morphogenesis protein [Pasteurella bettyae]|uniref:phage virion morphogenesis protein n=1 Tax=Pasteurella bettyae TaxID=752 RepID=UPI003D2934AD
MATVDEIHAKLTALLANISPPQRRKLAKNIGMQLRKSQSARIVQQQNPDGSAYEPRKPRKERVKSRKTKGRVKRQAMFAKLRTARFLKVRSNSDEVSVGFEGRNAHIANVHQYGLTARVRGNLKAKYAQRELLGFTDNDLDMIEDLMIEALDED